jgi:hypothetical protein
MDKGLGDTIRRVTTRLGVRTCGSCQKRAAVLNRYFPYYHGEPTRTVERESEDGKVKLVHLSSGYLVVEYPESLTGNVIQVPFHERHREHVEKFFDAVIKGRKE